MNNKFIVYSHIKYIIMSLLALIVGVIKIPVLLDSAFVPWFLPVLFIWQCENDYHFNPIFIFLVTLLYDIFTGGILGISSLLFLIALRMVYNNRFILRGQSFPIKWASFSIWALVLYIVYYLSYCLFSSAFLNPLPFVINIIFLAITYPLFNKALQWADRNYE